MGLQRGGGQRKNGGRCYQLPPLLFTVSKMDEHRDTVSSTFPQFVASRRVSMYREKHFWTMWRMLRRYELLQGTVFDFETFSHKDLEGFRTFLINEHEYWTRDKETKK